jgi:hypothetical protein
MKIKHLNIPNTTENHSFVKDAVAEFMMEHVLTDAEIKAFAFEMLVETYSIAKHTIGDLAAMVKQTEIPKARPDGPSQPNRILCSGKLKGEYYFFTKEQDYEYSALEVKETTKEAQ